ncbi:MAG: NAD(P)H-dependent oxidoreductase [Christensenellaceae bacterium]|jgi:predicted homoserine dehydrogenase-like protein
MFGLYKKMERLELDGTPISLALVGTGTMGANFAESVGCVPGISLDVASDLRVDYAVNALKRAGINEGVIEVCETKADAEKALKSGKKVATRDFEIACSLNQVQVVYEATGVPDIYARVGISAINNKKHYITMNVEGDVCVGNLMNQWARNAGVVYTGIYGDEPGCTMLLYSEAKLLGMDVVAIGRSECGGGNLYWNKETIVPEMKKINFVYENKAMWASFCDGSKTNEECTMMANATGLRPDVRGMHKPTISFEDFVLEVPKRFRPKSEGGILNNVGVVDIINDPKEPCFGVEPNYVWEFVVVRLETQAQKEWINEMKGVYDGDTGLLYTPYHYGSVQSPVTVATAVIDKRAVIAPLEGNKRAADCVTMAKKDLVAGEIIDEMGGLCTVGRIECASITRKENLLPFALAKGAKLVRDVPKEGFLTYDDVEFEGDETLIQRMRKLQDQLFGDLH